MAPSGMQRWNPFRKRPKDTTSGCSKEPLEATPLGLKVVVEGDDPVVDIIAVHGLNGHRDKTWTAANNVHWLRDLLSSDIPNARIFCWGYDANTHGGRMSCQYLYSHATTLVSELCSERSLTDTI
ncbi:hypothetical protein EV356DRAFT_74665 [Viridothelium virens]|uniref:DUF676 domain-containing protein n=1 Tax=Viridothelium virens TaxID=1048519 RepID=A0A6A6GRT8_VIRVR|nr:hypothetical protein EV356DRAFT_74665 [Viridothelium virens]